MQYSGLTQLIATTAGDTIDSATLIDQLFPNHCSDSRDCGILDADSTDYLVTLVKLPFCREDYDDTEKIYKKFVSFLLEM